MPPGQFLSHKWPYELPYRGLRNEKQTPFLQGDVASSIRYSGCDDVTVDRYRCLGGRTLHWNAVTLRYAPQDFREWSLHGVEEDWPLTYEELEPYYDRIEPIIGVSGNDDPPGNPAGGEALPSAVAVALQRARPEPRHQEDGHSVDQRSQGGAHPALR